MTTETDQLSRVGTIAREKDPDRFLLAMLSPQEAREDIFSLIAFNHEIAKTRDTVSEGMLGQIRLQWWREAIEECFEGQPRRHEVVMPLSVAIQRKDLPKDLMLALIDAREQDLDETIFVGEEDLHSYAETTGGIITELMVRSLIKDDEASNKAARHVGTAWALVGLMRALPFQLRQRRVFLPNSLQNKHGLSDKDLFKGQSTEGIRAAVQDICSMAEKELSAARSLRRQCRKEAFPVLQQATLCNSYLGQLNKAGYDPFSVKLANKPGFRILKLLVNRLTNRF